MGIRFAAMSVLWGDVLGSAFEPWLNEVRLAGYDGIAGFCDELLDQYTPDRSAFGVALAEHGLQLASVDMFGIEDMDRCRRTCDFMATTGCRHLVCLGGEGKRPEDFDRLADQMNRVGEIALGYGIHAAYHNHCGFTGETFQDMEKLLSLVDPGKVFAMVDTGHATMDFVDLPVVAERAVTFLRRYWDRIDFLEFKDFNTQTNLDTPVGEGLCDHQAVFDLVKEKQYAGRVTVEQNGTSKGRSPLECARISREFIRTGLGA